MVDTKTPSSPKDKSGEEKKAVASGIAIGVVVILLIGWGFLFVKKLQSGEQLNFESARPSEFDFSSVREAQEQLKEQMQYSGEELRALRDTAVPGQMQVEVEAVGGYEADPFGNSEGI